MIPSALAGPALGAAVMAVAAAGGFAYVRLVHDPAVRAECRAQLDAQVSAIRLADQARALEAMASIEAEHRAQLAAAATIKERIIRVPVTTACIASPAVATALDGLRYAAVGGGAADNPGTDAGLPGGASTAAGNRR